LIKEQKQSKEINCSSIYTYTKSMITVKSKTDEKASFSYAISTVEEWKI